MASVKKKALYIYEVLAVRVGTKGWGWQSWGERKYSGGEAVTRARG
jgi:hypothetical protein